MQQTRGTPFHHLGHTTQLLCGQSAQSPARFLSAIQSPFTSLALLLAYSFETGTCTGRILFESETSFLGVGLIFFNIFQKIFLGNQFFVIYFSRKLNYLSNGPKFETLIMRHFTGKSKNLFLLHCCIVFTFCYLLVPICVCLLHFVKRRSSKKKKTKNKMKK